MSFLDVSYSILSYLYLFISFGRYRMALGWGTRGLGMGTGRVTGNWDLGGLVLIHGLEIQSLFQTNVASFLLVPCIYSSYSPFIVWSFQPHDKCRQCADQGVGTAYPYIRLVNSPGTLHPMVCFSALNYMPPRSSFVNNLLFVLHASRTATGQLLRGARLQYEPTDGR